MLKWIILGIIFYVIAGFSTSLIIQIHDSNVRDPFDMWTIDGHLEPSEIVAITFLWPMVALCMIWIYGIPKLFMGMYKLFVLIIFSIKAVMDTIALSSSEKPNQSETPTSSDHLSSELKKNSKKLEKNFGELDCISRADARSLICKIDIKHHLSGMSRKAFKDLYNGIDELPSVTPQEARTEWEQDHEILKAYSDGANEVINKLRAEIKHFMYDVNPSSSESDYVCNYILQIIDKYKRESENEE